MTCRYGNFANHLRHSLCSHDVNPRLAVENCRKMTLAITFVQKQQTF
jgi:hypothetical protein